jgi:hypothetical protein
MLQQLQQRRAVRWNGTGRRYCRKALTFGMGSISQKAASGQERQISGGKGFYAGLTPDGLHASQSAAGPTW